MTSMCAGKRRGLWSKASAIVLGIGAAVLLGGCNNAMKDENAALMQENAQLREQNTQMAANQSALQDQIAKLQAAPQPDLYTAPMPGGSGTTTRFNPTETVIEIAGDVLFDSGQATLKSSARKELDAVASRIKSRHSGRTVRIEGHTDSDPIRRSKWGSNEALSQARADAVRDYLVTKGISRSSISTLGMGASQPKGSKAASRRVEVVIVDQ